MESKERKPNTRKAWQRWYYAGSPLANIKALEADGQPWAIIRYRMGGRFVDGDSEVVYELVIFQTFNAEECYDTLAMTRAQFFEVLEGLGMSYEPRYKSIFGKVYGRDDRLSKIVKEYNSMRDKARVGEMRLHEKYISWANRISNGRRDEETLRNLEEAREAYRSLVKKNKAKADAFIKKHNIIQYNF